MYANPSFHSFSIYNIDDLCIEFKTFKVFGTWVPRLFESVVRGSEPLGGDPVDSIIPAASLASQYGVIVAVVFFRESATARLLWFNLFKRLAYTYCSNKSRMVTLLLQQALGRQICRLIYLFLMTPSVKKHRKICW